MVEPRFEQQQFMRFLTALTELKAKTYGQRPRTQAICTTTTEGADTFFTDLYDDQKDLYKFITRLRRCATK